MEVTKGLLIDAIIGKGFVGSAKHRSMEIQLFSQLDLVGWTGEPFESTPQFSRFQLERLSLADLEIVYTRKYEETEKPKIILAKVIPQQPKRLS